MRPQLFYVVFENGEIVAIVEGAAAARKISYSFKGFKTRDEAEEFACWWLYDNPRWETSTRINTMARSA